MSLTIQSKLLCFQYSLIRVGFPLSKLPTLELVLAETDKRRELQKLVELLDMSLLL